MVLACPHSQILQRPGFSFVGHLKADVFSFPLQQTRSHKLTFIVPNAQVVVIPYEYSIPDT